MKKFIMLSLVSTLSTALATTPGSPGLSTQPFPAQNPFEGMDLDQLMQNGDLQELMRQLQQQIGPLGQQQNWQAPFRPQGPMTYLGVKLGPVSDELAHHMGLPQGFYQTVQGLEEGSPAENAGLQAFDIITHLDDQEIINAQQLVTLVRGKEAGDEIAIKILRKGKKQELTATLVEREGGDALPLGADPHMDLGQLFKNLQQGFGQVPQAPAPRAPGRPAKPRIELIPRDAPQVERNIQSSSSISIRNDLGHFQFNQKNGDKHLVIKDAGGNVMFDGPVNTDDERKSVPEEYRDTLKQLEGDGKGNFHFKHQFRVQPQQPPKPKLQKTPQAL